MEEDQLQQLQGTGCNQVRDQPIQHGETILELPLKLLAFTEEEAKDHCQAQAQEGIHPQASLDQLLIAPARI